MKKASGFLGWLIAIITYGLLIIAGIAGLFLLIRAVVIILQRH